MRIYSECQALAARKNDFHMAWRGPLMTILHVLTVLKCDLDSTTALHVEI